MGARSKTYYAQGDPGRGSQRRSVKVRIGGVEDISARSPRRGEGPAGGHRQGQAARRFGRRAQAETGPTLREAWARYRDVHMGGAGGARPRSPATRTTWSGCSATGWLPLMTLGENPRMKSPTGTTG
ncbi:hypothetical protein ACRAWD_13700 [Caulobacter segnis]